METLKILRISTSATKVYTHTKGGFGLFQRGGGKKHLLQETLDVTLSCFWSELRLKYFLRKSSFHFPAVDVHRSCCLFCFFSLLEVCF